MPHLVGFSNPVLQSFFQGPLTQAILDAIFKSNLWSISSRLSKLSAISALILQRLHGDLITNLKCCTAVGVDCMRYAFSSRGIKIAIKSMRNRTESSSKTVVETGAKITAKIASKIPCVNGLFSISRVYRYCLCYLLKQNKSRWLIRFKEDVEKHFKHDVSASSCRRLNSKL